MFRWTFNRIALCLSFSLLFNGEQALYIIGKYIYIFSLCHYSGAPSRAMTRMKVCCWKCLEEGGILRAAILAELGGGVFFGDEWVDWTLYIFCNFAVCKFLVPLFLCTTHFNDVR